MSLLILLLNTLNLKIPLLHISSASAVDDAATDADVVLVPHPSISSRWNLGGSSSAHAGKRA